MLPPPVPHLRERLQLPYSHLPVPHLREGLQLPHPHPPPNLVLPFPVRQHPQTSLEWHSRYPLRPACLAPLPSHSLPALDPFQHVFLALPLPANLQQQQAAAAQPQQQAQATREQQAATILQELAAADGQAEPACASPDTAVTLPDAPPLSSQPDDEDDFLPDTPPLSGQAGDILPEAPPLSGQQDSEPGGEPDEPDDDFLPDAPPLSDQSGSEEENMLPDDRVALPPGAYTLLRFAPIEEEPISVPVNVASAS